MNARQRPQLIAGIHWVRGEIEQSIARARGLIDHYAESGGDPLQLQQAYNELDQVRGTAAMIQCYGMAAVAGEMAAGLQDLAQHRISDPEPLYSALLGGTIQLSDYLQALADGTPDSALVMQPAINELRLARGQPVFTESDLFVAQMQALGLELAPPSGGAAQPGAAQREAARLLPVFQAALLTWVRSGADAQTGAARAGKVSELIAQAAVRTPVHQLWRVAAACIEAHLARGIGNVLELKRLFGRLVPQLKVLAADGEDAAAAEVGELSLQLLFLLGRATAGGPRVQAVRQAFDLDAHLPDAAALDQLRRRIHGPSTSLLSKVAEEIRADFARVKDQIDLIVRAGGAGDVSATVEGLNRIGPTLGALGLVRLQQVVAGQVRLLGKAGSGADPSVWMELATSILRVENDLEEALFRQMQRREEGGDEVTVGVPASRDLAEGQEALYRESLVNLARIKSAADAWFKGGTGAEVPEMVRLFGEIAAGFDVLEQPRAAELCRRARHFVGAAEFERLRGDIGRSERFADAVAAIEYYVEAKRAQLPTADAILDDLERALDTLDAAVAEAVAPGVEVIEPAPLAEALPTEAPRAEPAGGVTPAAAAGEAFDAGEDPEIREIFLEEAAEVLQTLQGSFAAWSRDPQDREALTTLRRAFHTLKGSGRTVGAADIGGFGWALENMLNRCLDGSIAISPGVVETVGRALAVLPGLIEAFRARRGAPDDVASVTAAAAEYAAGRTPGAVAEPDMLSIFREDAIERLSHVDAWVDARAGEGEIPVERDIVRAFHTVKGAARAIEAQAIGDVAGAIEAYLDAAADARVLLGPEARGALREAAAVLRGWVGELGTPAAATQDPAPWLERIHKLRSEVPEEALRSSADRQLAEIFAGEAFDLVSKIEEQVRGWTQAPDNIRAAQELRTLSHTLLGAAQMSACTAIADVARALHRAFSGAAAATIVPDPEAIATLLAVCEGLFQYLDRYREGRLGSDDAGWAARVDALGWAGELPAPAEPAAVAPAAGVAAAPAAVDEAGAAGEEAEEVLEMPPVEPVPESAEPDPELLAIFQAEAEELLEGLDQSVSALERDPRNLTPLGEIKRLLHTFKGSARVSGLGTLGDVAHRLESLFERLELGEVRAGTNFFARVQNALDGLNLALDDIRRGVVPEPVQLLDELAQPLVSDAAPAPAPAPMPAAAPVPPTAPAARAAAAVPAQVLPDDFDVELAQTFTAEAEELMEILEEALPRWQALPGDYSPARDMLRALHTYKGGARMAGLMGLGEAAHELESLIEGLEYAGELDAGALKVVAGAVSELRRMTDRLQRGEYAALIALGGAAEETAEATAEVESAPAPTPAAAEAPLELAAVPAEPAVQPAEELPAGMWHPLLFWRPGEQADALSAQRRETARVPVETLDRLLNEAGEISIYRSRMDEHNAAIQSQLEDMTQAIHRVRDQLRQLEIETEAQIAARGFGRAEGPDRYAGEFDPLEMDRFTRMQELSRALNESVGDLGAVHASIDQLASETTTILLQQGRVTTEVQQGLMRTLMVPFSRQVARLQRVVQQTALENGKRVEIAFEGVEAELDRNVLERMTAPLEHLLRNAVIHGIESPADRERAGKAATGRLRLHLWREGSQLFIELADDGRGLDLQAIRETAIRRGLMPHDAVVSDDEAAQFIFMPGFSTAKQLTQDAGRGVGMDVVAAEVKQLGGSLELASETGKGARFKVRLPLTLAMAQSLLVGVGHELYAAPLSSIEGIARIPREELDGLLSETGPEFAYGGQHYRVRHLADLVGLPREIPEDLRTVHAVLVRMPEGIGGDERRVAVVVDHLVGSRQVVSKAVGPQISAIPGISGATILADGRVVLILDISELVQDRTRRVLRTQAAVEHGERLPEAEARRQLIMVVDDSITIRRVTERLLARHGFEVITAKDGLDAMAQLQTERPDAILLDIEMPRADGFEVAAFVRNSAPIARTPILMITSRSGEKHRERAQAIGVDRYLIKPYQEDQLLDELHGVLKERSA
ncbi:Hpt domain-containing protein [Fontimonas sp. SYSU GA230001]|uniref:hybrid sensor histidine kinase/response regulator n=1 Tax=Fontimonas sp. SYSU GA230001 TaxID=3142450 RepID=UPI0032B5BEDC